MGEWHGGHRGESPAIAELKEALFAAVPLLKASPAKIGTTRQDGSRHDAGLAMDIMLDSRKIDEKAVADSIIQAVVSIHPKMKWSSILYTDWKGDEPDFFHIPGAPPFGGPNGMLKKNPNKNVVLGKEHINHVHIDWWTGNPLTLPPSASTRHFKFDLVNELQKPPEWLTDYMSRNP
jgi:hypothetical protein